MSLAAIGSVTIPKYGPVSMPSSSRNVVAPVMSSPASKRVLNRRRPAPGGQQREVQVDPAVARDVERRPRDQRAVRHHRAAVGRDLRQPLEELGLARPPRGQHLDLGFERELLDRRDAELAPTTGRRVGTGEHGDDLVPLAGEQRPQARQRGGGRAGEEQAHRATAPGRTAGEG